MRRDWRSMGHGATRCNRSAYVALWIPGGQRAPLSPTGRHGVSGAWYTRTMTQTQTLQCISTREAADLLTVARSTIYRMIERGELRSVKVGGRTVILKSDLAALLGVEVAS